MNTGRALRLSMLLFVMAVHNVCTAQTGVDLVGDGRSEIAMRSATGQLLSGRLVNSQFQFSLKADPGVNFRVLGVADFDGDGKSDLAYQDKSQGDTGEVRIWPDFVIANSLLLRTVKRTWDVQAVGDLDGDGYADFVWRYLGFTPDRPDDTGVSYIWFTNGRSVTQVRKRGGAPLNWKLIGALDFNGDGADDMVYVSPDHQVRLLMATPDRTCANVSGGTIPPGFSVVKLGDFTGSRLGEIVIRNAETGQVGMMQIDTTGLTLPAPTANPDDPNAPCTPSTLSATVTLYIFANAPPGWQFYAAGDLNGDGKTDIVWLRPDGSLTVWLMNGIVSVPATAPPPDGSVLFWPMNKFHMAPIIAAILVNAGNAPGGLAVFDMVSQKLPAYRLVVGILRDALGGIGTVTSTPVGINCGSNCSATYVSGTTVVLTATPATGSRFTGWGGACLGIGVCTVFVNPSFTDPSLPTPAPNVTARFEKTNAAVITVRTIGTGGGSVSSAPSGIDCGTTCSAAYAIGTVVTLTASANASSRFIGWTGACIGTGPCVLPMNIDQAVNAIFDLPPQLATYSLTVTRTGLGNGAVTSLPAGINCGATCSAIYAAGSIVTLTAVPAIGSQFNGWSGDCIGTLTCVVSMTQIHNVSARFDPPAVLNPLTLVITGPLVITQHQQTNVQLPWIVTGNTTSFFSFHMDTLRLGVTPPGTIMNLNGFLIGSPILAGIFTFSICVVEVGYQACQPVTVQVLAAPCVYTVSSPNANFAAAGGNGQFTLTTTAGCFWTAVSDSAWLTVSIGGGSAGSAASGSGSSTIAFTVAANPGTAQRTGRITVAGQTVTITQAGTPQPCTFAVAPNSANIAANAGGGQFTLTTTAGCFWTAVSDSAWLVVGSASGSAGSTLTYTATANPTATPRVGRITVGGQTVTITQAGTPPPPSSCSISSIIFTSNPSGFGFINGVITPALSNIPITCTWRGNLGSTSTRNITTAPNGSFTCASSDVASWSDPSITITAAVTACTNVSVSRTY